MESTNEIGTNPAGAQSSANGATLSGKLGACWPWAHKWEKWKDFAKAETKRNVPVLIQERRCAICNIAQRRLETCT